MKTEPLLTVAIPTFNRPNQLRDTLVKLLPQLTDECFLLIIDNHSDPPVSETVKDLFEKFSSVRCEIRRNRVNVSGDVNITRCFEYCETKWLWTLGDDDEITKSAVSDILSDIDRYPDVIQINYCSPHLTLRPARTNTKMTSGRAEFIKGIDTLGGVMMISTNVFNVQSFVPNSYGAFRYTYSCAAQIVVVLLSLTDSQKAVFSHKIICRGAGDSTDAKTYSNSNLTIIRGLSTLIDLPFDVPTKKLIVAKLEEVALHWLRVEAAVKSLLVDYYNSGKKTKVVKEYRRLHKIFFSSLGLKIYLRSFFWLSVLTISRVFTFQLIRFGYLKSRGIDIKSWLC